jgi:hypothetical protein
MEGPPEYLAIVKLARITGYKLFLKEIQKYEGELSIRHKTEMDEIVLLIKGEESKVMDAIETTILETNFKPCSYFGIYGYDLQPDESFEKLSVE